MMKKGMKRRVAAMMEWVGPRWGSPGIIMSMSGITDRLRTRGMFIPIFNVLDDA